MKVPMLLAAVVAAALTGSAAEASVSVTINFPAAGDSWCGTDNGVGTCGTLTSQWLQLGNMQDANDFVTSSLSNADAYPIPAEFCGHRDVGPFACKRLHREYPTSSRALRGR